MVILRNSNRGFSLLELIIAVVIITFVAFIFLKATDTLGRISRANHQTIAFHIAARKIEAIRGGVFGAIPPSGAFTDSELSKLPQGSANLTVTNYDGSSQIKQVKAKVSWFEQSQPKEVVITTLVSEYGLHK